MLNCRNALEIKLFSRFKAEKPSKINEVHFYSSNLDTMILLLSKEEWREKKDAALGTVLGISCCNNKLYQNLVT